MIDIDRVTWTYPDAPAPSLRDLSVRVGAGELVVLCGASGSGKSTALRLMNGLVPHFHERGTLTGTITVDGLVTTTAELDQIGLRTGTVLQQPRRQFFTDSVTEELAFAMENFGFPPEVIRARVDHEVAGLAPWLPLDRRLRDLSGGQQQQVAIGASSAHAPSVVLLDEPSSNLAPDAVGRLQANLEVLKRRGMTVVVAEHRLRYLEGLLDRVVVLRDGAVDRQWDAGEFRRVPDAVLAEEGLRGDVRTAVLPALPASGPSVADPVPAGSELDAAPVGALDLTGVSCRLGGRTVLDVDRVTFPARSVTALRGANGAGKSTLARVVAGLRSASGTIRLDGAVVRGRTRQRLTALVMQDVQRQLFTESVEVEVALATRGDRSGQDPRALLASLGLGHLASRHPLSLSGGEQQRLVVAVARLSRRPVVVFDEPSSGVDRRHLASISALVRQVADDGAVVLLISHDEDLLALAADQQLTLVPPAER